MPRPTFTRYQMVPLAKTVTTNMQTLPAGDDVEVEGYWDEITGTSWMYSNGNPAALVYAMRSVDANLPLDDDVLYVKYGPLGSLVHVSELDLSDAS